MLEEPVAIPSAGVELHGVLRLPGGPGPHPVVVLIHGSLEQDRDGNMLADRDGRRPPPHPFLREHAVRLTRAGFGALSWDKRGFGLSGQEAGDYWDQAADAAAALDLLGGRGDVDAHRRFVFGQSAGVFVASILAGRDSRPRAYVLSGGLGSSFRNMMQVRYGRVRDYITRSEDNRSWVAAHHPTGLALATNLERFFAEVDAGAGRVRVEHGGHVHERVIDRRTWDEEVHARMVRNVTAPALVIHGTADYNVPPSDADRLVAALRDAGNRDVEQVWIDGVDHSFQEVPADEDLALREQLSLECFRRPYREEYFDGVIAFLQRCS